MVPSAPATCENERHLHRNVHFCEGNGKEKKEKAKIIKTEEMNFLRMAKLSSVLISFHHQN